MLSKGSYSGITEGSKGVLCGEDVWEILEAITTATDRLVPSKSARRGTESDVDFGSTRGSDYKTGTRRRASVYLLQVEQRM